MLAFVFGANRHEARHLLLGEPDFLAAELGVGEVAHLERWAIECGGSSWLDSRGHLDSVEVDVIPRSGSNACPEECKRRTERSRVRFLLLDWRYSRSGRSLGAALRLLGMTLLRSNNE